MKQSYYTDIAIQYRPGIRDITFSSQIPSSNLWKPLMNSLPDKDIFKKAMRHAASTHKWVYMNQKCLDCFDIEGKQ